MSKWDKLLLKIRTLSNDIRFEELQKILESYGYKMYTPRGGSSHFTFRKNGCASVTIPKQKPINKVYIELVREIVEQEEKKMRQIDDYLKLPYKIELIPDIEEGDYAVSCPELPGCISCGNTLAEAMENIEDAKLSWLTAALEEGQTIPEPENLGNYSGQFKLRMPKSLHKKLAEHSKKEGISMNQYCLYLLTMNDAHRTAAHMQK